MFDSVLFYRTKLCSLFCNINGKNGKWLSILAYRALESVSIASALSTTLTIYPCQIRVHQRWQFKLQLPTARKKDWRPATADSLAQAVTCQHCDTHYFSRPRTRCATSIVPPTHQLRAIRRHPLPVQVIKKARVSPTMSQQRFRMRRPVYIRIAMHICLIYSNLLIRVKMA